MSRPHTCLLLLGLALAPSAQAETPYVWAIGPKLGTIFIPGHYPSSFPPIINNYDFLEEGDRAGDPDNVDDPDRDLDADGLPRFTSLERVRDDVQIGVDGFFGIDKVNRIGGGLGLALGKRYIDYWLHLQYDRVIWDATPFNLVAGGAVGFGQMRFNGIDEDESLRVPYFPLRARLQAQYLDNVRLYGLGLYVQTAVPSNTFYNDLDGVEQPAVGGPLNFVYNFSAGIELQVMFGDLTPPKKKKKGKKG